MLFELELAGLDFGKVEDVIDDGEQSVGAAAGGFDVFALFVGQFGIQKQGGHADDAIHGRADFVAHVGQEFRFGERGFLKFLVQREERCIGLDELLLAFPQSAISGVALDQVRQRLGVVADASD